MATDEKWPPDFEGEIVTRAHLYSNLAESKNDQLTLRDYYVDHPVEFILRFGWTYDPRRPTTPVVPFLIFKKQRDFIRWTYDRISAQEKGLVDKSRDMGVSWLCCWIAIHQFLFTDASVGFGSRKEALVDRKGDMDSLFEKIRFGIRKIPHYFKPGLKEREHFNHMRLLNPETGASITGEGGDNIGRGGRKRIYFVDECAFLENQAAVEAALSQTTNTRIDVSTVNSPVDLYWTKRQSGTIPIFVFDWHDHPAKDQAWYDKQKEYHKANGLMAQFGREIERDPTAARERVLIPGPWVRSAVDAHIKLGIEITGGRKAALDVADEGMDKNALVITRGILVEYLESWALGDTGDTTHKAAKKIIEYDLNRLIYDSIGVGAGVKATIKQYDGIGLPKIWPKPFNSSSGVLLPENKNETGLMNKDTFYNLKSQMYWELRKCFLNTYLALEGKKYNPKHLISLPSDLPELDQLLLELTQPQIEISPTGKMLIEKQPEGTRSPNLADCLMMSRLPIASHLKL